eukprot:GHVQ01004035.1.p1 GENE.GHVQ01004035.1~~GHVQ01004035.1.p1  ORF type:complete len:1943 (-),score=234.62 GHVQ01004035.1:575-6337(-)
MPSPIVLASTSTTSNDSAEGYSMWEMPKAFSSVDDSCRVVLACPRRCPVLRSPVLDVCARPSSESPKLLHLLRDFDLPAKSEQERDSNVSGRRCSRVPWLFIHPSNFCQDQVSDNGGLSSEFLEMVGVRKFFVFDCANRCLMWRHKMVGDRVQPGQVWEEKESVSKHGGLSRNSNTKAMIAPTDNAEPPSGRRRSLNAQSETDGAVGTSQHHTVNSLTRNARRSSADGSLGPLQSKSTVEDYAWCRPATAIETRLEAELLEHPLFRTLVKHHAASALLSQSTAPTNQTYNSGCSTIMAPPHQHRNSEGEGEDQETENKSLNLQTRLQVPQHICRPFMQLLFYLLYGSLHSDPNGCGEQGQGGEDTRAKEETWHAVQARLQLLVWVLCAYQDEWKSLWEVSCDVSVQTLSDGHGSTTDGGSAGAVQFSSETVCTLPQPGSPYGSPSKIPLKMLSWFVLHIQVERWVPCCPPTLKRFHSRKESFLVERLCNLWLDTTNARNTLGNHVSYLQLDKHIAASPVVTDVLRQLGVRGGTELQKFDAMVDVLRKWMNDPTFETSLTFMETFYRHLANLTDCEISCARNRQRSVYQPLQLFECHDAVWLPRHRMATTKLEAPEMVVAGSWHSKSSLIVASRYLHGKLPTSVEAKPHTFRYLEIYYSIHLKAFFEKQAGIPEFLVVQGYPELIELLLANRSFRVSAPHSKFAIPGQPPTDAISIAQGIMKELNKQGQSGPHRDCVRLRSELLYRRIWLIEVPGIKRDSELQRRVSMWENRCLINDLLKITSLDKLFVNSEDLLHAPLDFFQSSTPDTDQLQVHCLDDHSRPLALLSGEDILSAALLHVVGVKRLSAIAEVNVLTEYGSLFTVRSFETDGCGPQLKLDDNRNEPAARSDRRLNPVEYVESLAPVTIAFVLLVVLDCVHSDNQAEELVAEIMKEAGWIDSAAITRMVKSTSGHEMSNTEVATDTGQSTMESRSTLKRPDAAVLDSLSPSAPSTPTDCVASRHSIHSAPPETFVTPTVTMKLVTSFKADVTVCGSCVATWSASTPLRPSQPRAPVQSVLCRRTCQWFVCAPPECTTAYWKVQHKNRVTNTGHYAQTSRKVLDHAVLPQLEAALSLLLLPASDMASVLAAALNEGEKMCEVLCRFLDGLENRLSSWHPTGEPYLNISEAVEKFVRHEREAFRNGVYPLVANLVASTCLSDKSAETCFESRVDHGTRTCKVMERLLVKSVTVMPEYLVRYIRTTCRSILEEQQHRDGIKDTEKKSEEINEESERPKGATTDSVDGDLLQEPVPEHCAKEATVAAEVQHADKAAMSNLSDAADTHSSSERRSATEHNNNNVERDSAGDATNIDVTTKRLKSVTQWPPPSLLHQPLSVNPDKLDRSLRPVYLPSVTTTAATTLSPSNTQQQGWRGDQNAGNQPSESLSHNASVSPDESTVDKSMLGSSTFRATGGGDGKCGAISERSLPNHGSTAEDGTLVLEPPPEQGTQLGGQRVYGDGKNYVYNSNSNYHYLDSSSNHGNVMTYTNNASKSVYREYVELHTAYSTLRNMLPKYWLRDESEKHRRFREKADKKKKEAAESACTVEMSIDDSMIKRARHHISDENTEAGTLPRTTDSTPRSGSADHCNNDGDQTNNHVTAFHRKDKPTHSDNKSGCIHSTTDKTTSLHRPDVLKTTSHPPQSPTTTTLKPLTMSVLPCKEVAAVLARGSLSQQRYHQRASSDADLFDSLSQLSARCGYLGEKIAFEYFKAVTGKPGGAQGRGSTESDPVTDSAQKSGTGVLWLNDTDEQYLPYDLVVGLDTMEQLYDPKYPKSHVVFVEVKSSRVTRNQSFALSFQQLKMIVDPTIGGRYQLCLVTGLQEVETEVPPTGPGVENYTKVTKWNHNLISSVLSFEDLVVMENPRESIKQQDIKLHFNVNSKLYVMED